MIKFAVMTFMYEKFWKGGDMSHEDMIAGFAKQGVLGVEPFHTFFVDDPGLVARYRKALGDHGMRVSAVDVICDLVYADQEQWRKGRDELRRGIDVCAALGAEVAHVAGHMPKDGVGLDDARKMIADGLLEQAEYADGNDLILAIEDFGFTPTLMCTAADCLEVMNLAQRRVWFVFDNGNFEFAGEHATDNFDRLYERACYWHFKDWVASDQSNPHPDDVGAFRGCPMGEGIVPNKAIANRMKERGYDGWVALEATCVAEDPVATVKRDLPVMKRWLK